MGKMLRLVVTLLAVTCMLARAVMPVPAEAHGSAAELRLLGAALCHSDGDSPSGPGDGGMPLCDHCPVCGVAAAIPPVPAALQVAMPVMLAVSQKPAAINPQARPRAPPGHAHNPRAPPAL